MTPPLLHWPLIRSLARASADVYLASTVSDPATDAQASVDVDIEGDIVVAFRGSSSARDFLVDASFWMSDLMWSNDDLTASVHHGFLKSFEAINEEVVRQVRAMLVNFPDALIYICGHSLGGALAQLCALEFVRQKLPVSRVVTFGSPRVGNKAFAVCYNAARHHTLKNVTWNFVNQGDPVPLLPPLLNGYRDCGTELFITRDLTVPVRLDPFIGWELFADLAGVFKNWRRGELGLLPNHFIAEYQSRLEGRA